MNLSDIDSKRKTQDKFGDKDLLIPMKNEQVFDHSSTCESFNQLISPYGKYENHESTRKQAFSAAPFRSSESSHRSSTKSIKGEGLFMPNQKDHFKIKSFNSFQSSSTRLPNPNAAPTPEHCSKVQKLKASLPPLRPSLPEVAQSDFLPTPAKSKLTPIESATSSTLLEELDRQHESYKQSVEAIRASLCLQ